MEKKDVYREYREVSAGALAFSIGLRAFVGSRPGQAFHERLRRSGSDEGFRKRRCRILFRELDERDPFPASKLGAGMRETARMSAVFSGIYFSIEELGKTICIL